MKKFIFISMLLLVLTILCNNFKVNAKELYISQEDVTKSMAIQNGEIRASHILVKTKEDAEKIRQEIIAGKDFATAAKEVSLCPSGKNGGDLGYFGKGAMVPEFEKAAFSLPVGKVSEPVKTQFGWHLIMVTEKK